ncbi:MAG TPA: SRPBCC family protein [Pyrinomonadaceae bacterium]|nr:SRPBCC family protein [Pyrinomonadaceae bacterium]
MERAEKSVEINAPVQVVFDLYSDFEKFPEWMTHIKEVRRTGESYTKWTADAPLGINVEWEAETTALEPNRKIAWQTVRGDVEMQGEVTFEEAGRGKTLMHVAIGYKPPAGHLGALVAKLLGNDPDKEIEEELSRFARLAEARAKKPQPRGKAEGAVKRRRSAKTKAA